MPRARRWPISIALLASLVTPGTAALSLATTSCGGACGCAGRLGLEISADVAGSLTVPHIAVCIDTTCDDVDAPLDTYVPLPTLHGTVHVGSGSDEGTSFVIIDVPDEPTGGAVHDGAIAYLAVYEPTSGRTVYDRLADVPPRRTGGCVCGYDRLIR